MIFRKAIEKDLIAIVQMMADDELGKSREDFTMPLPSVYYQAFLAITSDLNQELIVVENEANEIIGTELYSIPDLPGWTESANRGRQDTSGSPR
jgi:hypothetical protein